MLNFTAMKKLVVICGFLSFSAVAIAQNTPTKMTKMEVRLQSPDAPAGSFASLPKIMYRAAAGYCRIEEAPDPEHGIHGLLIVNEPDAWMVNLQTKSATHIVDPGPTFFCNLPIFSSSHDPSPGDPKMSLSKLEFGRELEYFKSMGATPGKGLELQGQQTTGYVVNLSPSASVALFTYGPSNVPLAVVHKVGDTQDIFWYSGYGEIPFDPKLFAKPAGVKIEEQKH
jgi:hypothetical protein